REKHRIQRRETPEELRAEPAEQRRRRRIDQCGGAADQCPHAVGIVGLEREIVAVTFGDEAVDDLRAQRMIDEGEEFGGGDALHVALRRSSIGWGVTFRVTPLPRSRWQQVMAVMAGLGQSRSQLTRKRGSGVYEQNWPVLSVPAKYRRSDGLVSAIVRKAA